MSSLEALTIETPRMILRNFRMEDAQDCFAFLSDAETCRLDGGYPPFTDMQSAAFRDLMARFAARKRRYMMVRREDGRVMGTVMLRQKKDGGTDSFDVGYVIAPEYRRQGYTFEALSALMECARQAGVKRLTATTFPDNPASQRLLGKLGFVQTGEDAQTVYFEVNLNAHSDAQ